MQISIDTSAYNDQMHVCFNLQQEVNAQTYAVCSSKSSKEVKNKYILSWGNFHSWIDENGIWN